MTWLQRVRAMLRDKKRSQRGSVLSGVLIMTAFIAILSGALMTELSTNFILSSHLMDRAANEATVDSAMELALNQLQSHSVGTGCPSLGPAQATLNGRTAVPTYQSCWPDYRERSYSSIASGPAFNVQGTHSNVVRDSLDMYVVGDSDGTIFQFKFGTGNLVPGWPFELPGPVTAPPDTFTWTPGDADDLLTFAPVSISTNQPPGCESGSCVAVMYWENRVPPQSPCYAAAAGPVTTPVAVGANFPSTFFYGDQTGALYATTRGCNNLATSPGTGQQIVAGPFVFPGPPGTDEIFAVSTTAVLHSTYTFRKGVGQLTTPVSTPLPFTGAVGASLDSSSLPSKLAVTFGDGHVALYQLQTSFTPALTATTALASNTQSAPTWAKGSGQFAVAGTDGALYILDANLNVVSTMAPIGTSILGAPATDSVGEWFFGGADGFIHEVQPSGSALAEVARYGPLGGPVTSSPQVGPCSPAVCIYLGTQDGSAYLVPLDARSVVLSACISDTPPNCSGAGPRLRAQVEVGSDANPLTVHVQGWSYYSG